MRLSLNSTAVVIGAMFAAPLMTPVLGTALVMTASVNEAVVSWLAPSPRLEATAASFNGDVVSVDVAGPVPPPSSRTPTQALGGLLGRRDVAHIRWLRTTQ